MNEWLSTYWWIFACVACYFAGMATVMAWRIYGDIKEDRQLAREQRLLENGPDYDEDADIERITDGWDVPTPVSPGSVTVIAPSPLLKEPSGGYATVGTVIRKPDVDQRYATLQWLDTNREPAPVIRARARVLANGEGRHRTENVFTREIDLSALMDRIEMENSWRQEQSSTGPLALSAASYATAR